MDLKDLYKIFLQFPQICTDSRKVQPGSLFFGLRGEQYNGNRFAAAALDQGSVLAVVDDPEAVLNDRCMLVENSLTLLQELAAFHRSRLNVPVIGLTGTNGKTTTKELIYSVLSQKHRTIATAGNLNNHLGVPLTLLRADQATEMVILEMGANHPGEIRDLCRITRPTHGLVTNIGKAHLEGFGSYEGVRQAKRELYDYLIASGGTVYINSDDEILTGLIGDYPVVTYGRSGRPFILGRELTTSLLLNIRWENPDTGQPIDIQTNLTGSYNFSNVLAAIAVGSYFGVDPHQVKLGVESHKPENLRSQWKQTEKNRLLLDAYNANPTSMAMALKHFATLDVPRKVVILGDMFELGEESAKEHGEILSLLLDLNFDNVLIAGKDFYGQRQGYPFNFFEDLSQIKDYLEANPMSDSTVLLKGSRGMQLESLVDYL